MSEQDTQPELTADEFRKLHFELCARLGDIESTIDYWKRQADQLKDQLYALKFVKVKED